MKALLILTGILTATAGLTSRAEAQNYPWCLQSPAYEGGENCGFVSFAQCQETRLGMGGFCQRNTQYMTPTATAAPVRDQKEERR
jgi:hypothetical protein